MKTNARPLSGPSRPGTLPQSESDLRQAFLREVERIPGGELLHRCIQCGSCSGSCPVSYAMDHSPREAIALFRAGAIETLLDSRTLWLCASCYVCTTRCPAGIQITDLLYGLKRVAMERGILPRRFPVYALSESFAAMVRRYGRNHESGLLLRYCLRAEPRKLLTGLADGFALWRHGRLPARPRPIADIEGLRRIIARAESFDRPQEPRSPRHADRVGYRAIGMKAGERRQSRAA